MAIAAVILGGLFRAHPAVPLDHHLGPATETVGLLLILRAFASGCSALTGVEAIANAVPEFRQPRARRAQVTEVWLGILLGVMLVGLGALIHKFSVVPQPGITVLAQLTQASLGHNIAFYAVQLITLVLLALAANTSFPPALLAAPAGRGQGDTRRSSRCSPSGCSSASRCPRSASSGAGEPNIRRGRPGPMTAPAPPLLTAATTLIELVAVPRAPG